MVDQWSNGCDQIGPLIGLSANPVNFGDLTRVINGFDLYAEIARQCEERGVIRIDQFGAGVDELALGIVIGLGEDALSAGGTTSAISSTYGGAPSAIEGLSTTKSKVQSFKILLKNTDKRYD